MSVAVSHQPSSAFGVCVDSGCLTADIRLDFQRSACPCTGRWLSIGACSGGVCGRRAELDVCRASQGNDSGGGQASQCCETERCGKLHVYSMLDQACANRSKTVGGWVSLARFRGGQYSIF